MDTMSYPAQFWLDMMDAHSTRVGESTEPAAIDTQDRQRPRSQHTHRVYTEYTSLGAWSAGWVGSVVADRAVHPAPPLLFI